MSDRFDFLEIDDGTPRPVAPLPENEPVSGGGLGWKPTRLRVLEVIGEQGTQGGQFNAPMGLAVDAWGALYVADSNNHRVQRITLNGDVWVYGQPGNGPGQLWGPQGVAVDPTGQFFYVAEQGNHRVQSFRIVNRQPQGSIKGLRGPSDLAFDVEEMLWIADTGNGRVLRANLHNGEFAGTLDRSVGIARPINVACDLVGNVYVTDAATNDVTRYNANGQRVQALGEIRRLAGPRQAAIDAEGRIYLAESEANRLHVFDAQGFSLVTFEGHTKLGTLRAPSGVALSRKGDVYLSDTLNHRILRLEWE